MAADLATTQEILPGRDRGVAGLIHQSRGWGIVVAIAILINSAALGVIASLAPGDPRIETVELVDKITLAALILDSLLCIAAKRSRILRDPWDMFDISVVAISLVPMLQSLSALRAFRTVRLLRLVTILRNGRATVDALFRAIRNMGAAMTVMAIVYYIFVIICTTMFREADPGQFGDLGKTVVSLYQLMIMFGADSDITRQVTNQIPWSWLVFVPFVFIASFALLNLVIGVFVSAVDNEMKQEITEENAELLRIEKKLDALAACVNELMNRVK
jgi:voltage-gated sodium channel